jgi:apolipoprotein N-acyltransferase
LRKILLAALSGLLYACSFPTYSLFPLAWIWLIPLLFLMEETEGWELFVYGMIAGMVAWAGIAYWIAYVMNEYGGMGLLPAAFLLFLLIAVLSLFFGAFAVAARRLTLGRAAFLLVPGMWALFELIRSYVPFSGFPWALLGYSQYPWISLVQFSEFGGVYLVGAVVVMGNVALYGLLRKRAVVPVLATVVLAVSLSVWGSFRMEDFHSTKGGVRTAVAQANIAQDQKWEPEMVDPTIDIYVRLTGEAVKQGAQVVVWPEASCPFFLMLQWPYTARIIALSHSTDARLIVGSPAYENGEYLNRMWMLEKGRIVDYYDKVHLVPFGEYLPLASLIKPIFSGLTQEVGDFSTAKREVSPIDDAGVMICFEIIFPDLARELTLSGASYLVNSSNDAWFKTWSTPRQHLEMSAFRAIENRRWLLSSTNHGYSAIIGPDGGIVRQIGLLQEGVIMGDIVPLRGLTFYTRFGPIIPIIWAGIAVIAALTRYRRKC